LTLRVFVAGDGSDRTAAGASPGGRRVMRFMA
jgi:hypothetical protein